MVGEEGTRLNKQCSLSTNKAACHSLSNPLSMATSKSFIKANSQTELAGQQAERKLDRLDSLRGSVSDVMAEDTFGPLSNVRYSSSALSSVYFIANRRDNIKVCNWRD